MLETSPKGVSPLDSLGLITSFPFRGINYRAGVPFKGLLKGVPVFRAVMLLRGSLLQRKGIDAVCPPACKCNSIAAIPAAS